MLYINEENHILKNGGGEITIFEVKKLDIAEVMSVLKKLRVQLTAEEYEIHNEIKKILNSSNIPFEYEYKLGPKNRIDFLVSGGVGIEVKKRRPNQSNVLNQLRRYSEFDEVQSLILVTGKSVFVPEDINGKAIKVLSLTHLWGISSS